MRIKDFFEQEGWDYPFFKILSKTDSGQAESNQRGFVVLRDLRKFFPYLDTSQASPETPTAARPINADLYIGAEYLNSARTAYRDQTRGAKRSPEGRVTGDLGQLHRESQAGDLLLLQRKADSESHYRFILVRRDTMEYRAIQEKIGDRTHGPLFEHKPPLTVSDIGTAETELFKRTEQPFVLKSPDGRPRQESRQNRIVRGLAFAKTVRTEYTHRCCVSGIQLGTPDGLYEVEAAHVVPVEEGGMDDPRNGIALSGTLHWAFDQGLFGIRHDRKVYLPRKARKSNVFLLKYSGQPISEATHQQCRVHDDALAWHIANRVSQWEK